MEEVEEDSLMPASFNTQNTLELALLPYAEEKLLDFQG